MSELNDYPRPLYISHSKIDEVLSHLDWRELQSGMVFQLLYQRLALEW